MTVTTATRSCTSFGARSLAIWSGDGRLVWDSGDDLERVTLAAAPEHFNSNHTTNTFRNRSDDKGPEPEAVTVGEVGGTPYAFVASERVGGVAVYDVGDPTAPVLVGYLNQRDFSVPTTLGGGVANPAAGDLGPEGLAFIAAAGSPLRGVPMLVVASEVSGTTTLFRIDGLGVEAKPGEGRPAAVR